MIDIKELRIRRLDSKNIVLERWVNPTDKKPAGSWRIIGYYGKVEDVVPTLLNLVVDIPQADDVRQQVELLVQNIRLAQTSITNYLKTCHDAIKPLCGEEIDTGESPMLLSPP